MGRKSRKKREARAAVTASAASPEAAARLILSRAGGRWTGTIEGARALADLIGPRLLAAFLRCFHGVDRLLALEHLWSFNVKCAKKGTVAEEFNLRLIVNTLASTMYETAKALQELCDARVVTKIRDKSKWDPINKLRGTWLGDHRLARMRNQLGFHLGDLDLYREGLDRLLAKSDTLPWLRGDGDKRHGNECVLAGEALLAGLQIEDSDLDAMLELTSQAHADLPNLLYALWGEVLETAGIPIIEKQEGPTTPPGHDPESGVPTLVDVRDGIGRRPSTGRSGSGVGHPQQRVTPEAILLPPPPP